MKQKLTFFTLLFSVAFLCSYAQDSSPYWSLSGNDNGIRAKLGTINTVPLLLYTKNLERMRIDTGGKVGIGITIPITKLHVAGSGSFGNRVTTANAVRALNLADTAAVMRILRVDFSNAPAVELISRTSADGTNKAYWDMYAQPSDASFRIRDRVNGLNDRLVISHSTGAVGIGTSTPCCKLDVEGTGDTVIFGNTTGNWGVMGKGSNAGIYGFSSNIGVYGTAESDDIGSGIGVYGSSSYDGVVGSGGNVGVQGYSSNGSSTNGYGVSGINTDNGGGAGVYASGTSGVVAHSNNSYGDGVDGYGGSKGGYFTGEIVGVQGFASGNAGSAYGVYGSSNSGYAGYFNGSLYAVTYTGSDRKLKQNIEDVTTGLDIINKLRPKTYQFRQDSSFRYMHLPEGKHYGLIAQDLEQVLPNLVKDTKFDTRIELEAMAKAKGSGTPETKKNMPKGEVIDFKAVNYTELIPILVKAMQELDAKNTDLKTVNETLAGQVNDLQTRISKLEAMMQGSNTSTLLLSSASLETPVPNPNNGSAILKYHLPATATTAQLLVTDAKGSVIKQIRLGNTGDGQMTLSTANLSSGTYNCTLLVNGQPAGTKTMVVGK